MDREEKVTVEVVTKQNPKTHKDNTYIVVHMLNGYKKYVFLSPAEQALVK